MKVLFNCLSSRSGGANAYILNIVTLLSDALAARNATLVVLAREDQQSLLGGIPATQRILVSPHDLAGVRRFYWEARNLDRIAAESGATVTFTPYQVGTLVRSTANVSMLRNMEPFFSSQYRYTVRSQLRNALLRRLSSRFLKGSDAVIAVSNYVLDYAQGELAVDPARLTRIYHGRDPAIATCDTVTDAAVLARLGVTPPYVFTCGSVLPYRRFEDIISAFDVLATASDDGTSLVLAGSGTDLSYENLLQARIRQSPAQHRIRYLGQVPYAAMSALYRQARLFVTSTEVEACPNIAIEAMTAGCAIVSADSPVLVEMFGDAAALYPARNVEALTTALRQHRDDEAARAALRARSSARAEHFSWQNCAEQTAEVLATLGRHPGLSGAAGK